VIFEQETVAHVLNPLGWIVAPGSLRALAVSGPAAGAAA
jgi:hypothetical protein